MPELTDAQLLRDYAEHGHEAAFRELVSRHADVVYASALRQVSSSDLAHDIAQSVFTDLARKAQPLARTLTGDASLLGWLFRSTRFLALNQLRDDRRRQARERQAMENFDATSETAPEWERVQPVLDEAMAELNDEDREALLLRYFKNRDFRAIGATLGVSDDAAQKRVSRALERLRTYLADRGVTTSAVALSTVLSANAVPLAPAGLAATLSTAALAGTTLVATTTATATKVIAMTTLQKTLITATIAVAVGTGIYEASQVSKLRDHVKTLQQQQAEEIQQLRRERDEATSNFAALREENQRLNGNAGELLKLRGEVARLRQTPANGKLDDRIQAPTESLLRLPAISRDSIAEARRDLSWDQTIVTGGWKSQPGSSNRVFVFASPKRGEDESQVMLETQIVECPESVAEALGLSQISTPMTTEGKSSDILTAVQYAAMMKSARAAAGVRFLGSPSITTLSGRQAQVRAADMKRTQSGEEFDVGPVVNLVPTISADGMSIDLRIFAHPNNLLPVVDMNH